MKKQISIKSSIQSAAKLLSGVVFVVVLTATGLAQNKQAEEPVNERGAMKAAMAKFAGVWKVRYQNNTTRTYNFGTDGEATWTEELGLPLLQKSKIQIEGNDYLINWGKAGENKVERLSIIDGNLRVEHFNPKEKLLRGESPELGLGKLLEAPPSKPQPQTPIQNAPGKDAPAPQIAKGAGKTIQLKAGWDTPLKGGSLTHADLAYVLADYGKPNPTPEFSDVEIFGGVRFLMPLKEALVVLGLNQRLPSAKMVACAGFPRDSFRYISFDGRFDGTFTRLHLVVDTADQVVCIQLVEEAPKGDLGDARWKKGDWFTFNFVESRMRATKSLGVAYSRDELRVTNTLENGKRVPRSRWSSGIESWNQIPVTLCRVNTKLTNKDGKVLERTRWYLPRPLADLILYCVGKGS